MEIITRNINTGFRKVIELLHRGDGVSGTGSRNGNAVRFDRATLIEFTNPLERCLFNSTRDVNPFSLIYESLWTLAGRNDVAPLCYYTKKMKEYSDDGVTWHGAYGHRWRHHFGYDQLLNAVEQLKGSSESRRIVIEMWDARVDGRGSGKDYPCNTHIYVTVRQGKLNITVCNRSNDTVWGLFGTNFVVFSFLQEYLASRIGVPVGIYQHFSNDLHAYTDGKSTAKWEPEKWLGDRQQDWYGKGVIREHGPITDVFPLVKDPEVFEQELPQFVESNTESFVSDQVWDEPFLRDVAHPALMAFHEYKHGATKMTPPGGWLAAIKADDWRIACTNWLQRRKDRATA